MVTTLANWTKMSSGCSSSFADAKFLGSTPIVFLSHCSVEIIHSQLFHINAAADAVPEAETPILEKLQKVYPGFD
jgi:hypothetical protein